MTRIGSLFSGAGGLDLAVERVTGGRTVWQVEREPAARRVLARHWPDADRSCEDVREARGLAAVDVVCGGFPCQDLSVAGKRAGLIDGQRSALFFELARIVAELRPSLVVLENVPGVAAWRREIETALPDYGCRWVAWSATTAGAPHLRRRVLVVAKLGGPAWPDLDLTMSRREWAARAADGRPWPTPCASNANEGETLASWTRRRDDLEARGIGTLSPPLAVAVRAVVEGVDLDVRPGPTPSVKGNDNRAGLSPTSGDGLATAARQAQAGPGPHRLNASWVEALMGWPVGWTEAEGASLRGHAEELMDAPRWPRGRPPAEHVGPWPGYAWEPSRTESGPPTRGRPARLRLCGNGVVPQAAALALAAALDAPKQPGLFG